MGLAIKVLACNGKCQSCYENSLRRINQNRYDFKKVYDTLKREIEKTKREGYNTPTIHGGEPLLLPLNDLKRFMKLIFNEYGQTGIQTNLLSLTDKHIELFQKYKTHVGVSLDGDNILSNKGRGYDPEPVIANIERLKNAGIPMSAIIVLRKYNVCNFYTYDPNSKSTMNGELIGFIKRLNKNFGIVDFRTNPGIVFDEKFIADEQLTIPELSNVFRELADLTFSNPDLMIQPFRDIVELMWGFYNATCNFGKCDPVKTSAETPINEIGELGNCLKNFGANDGISTLQADNFGSERYDVLYQLSQAQGGCRDCGYWHLCYGGCPGEGIDNDWRNRSRFCEAWKNLFSYVENKLKGLFPNIYLPPDFYPTKADNKVVCRSIRKSTWQKSDRPSKDDLIKSCEQKAKQSDTTGHGDSHGDKAHGDSNDPAWRKEHPEWGAK